MNTETPAIELVAEQHRSPMANPFIPGPNYDLARAFALLRSDPELAYEFADQAGVDLSGGR